MKKVNVYEDVYQIARDFIEAHNEKVGLIRTFRSMGQLFEEALMEYFREKN